jgi:hypothetical protein
LRSSATNVDGGFFAIASPNEQGDSHEGTLGGKSKTGTGGKRNCGSRLGLRQQTHESFLIKK